MIAVAIEPKMMVVIEGRKNVNFQLCTSNYWNNMKLSEQLKRGSHIGTSKFGLREMLKTALVGLGHIDP